MAAIEVSATVRRASSISLSQGRGCFFSEGWTGDGSLAGGAIAVKSLQPFGSG
jgi:hypothetical protein